MSEVIDVFMLVVVVGLILFVIIASYFENIGPEDYVKKLITLYKKNKELLKKAHTPEKEHLLTQHSALKAKLANRGQAYKDYIASLKKQISDLENNSYLSKHIKKQAIKALRKGLRTGDNKEADRLFANINDESYIIEVAEACYQRCLIAESEIRYHDASDFIQKASGFAPDNQLYLHRAGWLMNILGQYDKAIEYYNQSLMISVKTFWDDPKPPEWTFKDEHPDIAIIYNNLGRAYYAKGEVDISIEYYDKSLNIKLKTLGSVHYAEGKYDKAIECFNRSLAIMLKTLETEHPDVARSYYKLGRTYRAKEEYNQAIMYFNKALAIYLKTLGKNHPYTKSTLLYLEDARCYGC